MTTFHRAKNKPIRDAVSVNNAVLLRIASYLSLSSLSVWLPVN